MLGFNSAAVACKRAQDWQAPLLGLRASGRLKTSSGLRAEGGPFLLGGRMVFLLFLWGERCPFCLGGECHPVVVLVGGNPLQKGERQSLKGIDDVPLFCCWRLLNVWFVRRVFRELPPQLT